MRILLTALLSFAAWGQGDAPPLLRGQSQATNSVGAFIQSPLSQVTKLSSAAALIETGNGNVLVNPSFEHSLYSTGWTLGGTGTYSVESTVVYQGVKALEVATSSQTITLTQDVASSNIANSPGYASVRINNTAVGLTVCSRVDGADTANCSTAGTAGAWELITVPVTFGATSTGIVVKSASTTGTTYVDLAVVRPRQPGDAPTADVVSLAVIRDLKSAGSAGGGCTLGAWRTRDLNNEQYDPDGIVSISSNQFTLGAGTYIMSFSAPAAIVSTHQCRLQNITDGTTDIAGAAMYADTGGAVSNRCVIEGVITIAGTKVFEIQHQCANTRATNGFGYAGNFGISEVYTVGQIWKIN